MKNILITGGAGYIGTVLTEQLLDRGYNFKVVDTLWYGHYLSDKVQIEKKNILNITQAEIDSFDVVIFLGGVSNDPMAEYKPSINFTENMASSSYLAYITRQSAIKTQTKKRFIYASTCSVYGYTSNNLMSESDPIPAPHFPYGISKLYAEKAIMALENDFFKPIALRKGTVGGWSPRMRFDLVVNVMTKSALNNKQIVVNNPSLWRPLVDVRDAAEAYVRAIESNIDITGAYNISYDNYTIGRLADEIKEELEKTGEKISIKTLHKEDLRNYKVSTDKAKKELDFVAKFAPKDSVRKILENKDDININDEKYENLAIFKEIFK